jgi:2-polyprenyl-3-methyl-5-hydroxy-6-metoxy-1,4-benzoquinol methylase
MRDAVFDHVLSREGIEHFESQTGFVRECARSAVRAALVITTPNVLVGAVESFPHRTAPP